MMSIRQTKREGAAPQGGGRGAVGTTAVVEVGGGGR
jgi:hypothetical protein